ncbi:TIGR02679 family protein [Streptomyces antarcticus]|uniref:TIGR02679 family protein n=1 Tax=Streptomyces antarcticus TaxID=2996458 RepID=UPI00226F190A|nr:MULTISPECIES: TIGR02679 family protein [unclassified Streptomyces]MCY0946170.1 TIGR02679 family protein [Streptomyces sp. H34-AA3]MCZ4084978.1 TIGR02679 family protein [Streptomyces sp. H34-S5]
MDEARLHRLLGGADLAWLLERVRRRLERGQPLTGPVSLAAPASAQRAAAERLLGRAPGGGASLTVRLDAVDAVLRRSGISPEGLAAAVVTLTGPVVPLEEARRTEDRAWEEAYAPLTLLAEDFPPLAAWAARTRDDGLVRRLARTPGSARLLLDQAVRVLRELPCEPARSLSVFAADTLGRAHALDDGTPVATLALSGARALTGHPEGAGAAWRRAAWASAGLLRDDVSSTVLTLNLRGTPALDWMADAGDPCVLTLRQLAHRPPRTAPPVVHICENPAVLSAAADTHGPDARPLVCLQGQPSAAALTLLGRLHQLGAAFRYHGDFDWGGLRIAATLGRHVPWLPWRYTADDYREAVAAAGPGSRPLSGTPALSPWDPYLAFSLAEHGLCVEEETVLDTLLGDLRRR